MLYCAAIQGASWFLGWLCLKDFYTPQEIRVVSEQLGPEIVQNSLDDQGSARLANQEINDLGTVKTRMSEVTVTIAPERWHYSVIPRFRHFSDKLTFWSLVMAVVIGTL